MGCKTAAEHRRDREDSLRTLSMHVHDEDMRENDAKVRHANVSLVSFARCSSPVVIL